MVDNIEFILKIVAKNPPMAFIGGGILLLILSPGFSKFSDWGWGLITLGFILQIIWLYFRYGRN